MSFNINLKQPQKPKIGMKNEPTLSDKVGFDGNALSQKPKEVTNVEFGNTARDKMLQKEIKELREDTDNKFEDVSTQLDKVTLDIEDLTQRVEKVEDDVEHIDTKIDEKIDVEKEARIEADNQLQEAIDEIDEKIEHLDKYAEKTTTVGGISLEQSTDSLNTYKYRIPDGFKAIIDWSIFADVEREYLVYGEEENLDVITGDDEPSNLSFPMIALMKYNISETINFTAVIVMESKDIEYAILSASVEIPANTWCKVNASTQQITFEVPPKFEVDESLIQNKEYFNAIYTKEPSLINLEDKLDSIENSVQQQGSLVTQIMDEVESKFSDYDNDIEQLQDNLSNEEGTRQAQDNILQQNIDSVNGRVDDVEDTLDTPLKSWVYDKQGMTMQPVFNPTTEPQRIGTMVGTAQAICGESSAIKTIYKDTDNNITISISYSSGSTRRLYITYLVDGYEYKNNITGTLDTSTYQYTYYSSWQQISPTVKPISSQDDLPILSYSDNYIYNSNVDAVKAFLKYEANVHDNKTLMSDVVDGINQDILDEETARQQADTTLQGNIDNEATARQQADAQLQNAINTKTQEITIINQQITNWFINENQEFSNYAYVSNTTIPDLINAKYVNVSFSLSDLEINNICPIQVVDNTIGVLTIYSNDNSLITIPYIYIFK